MTNRGRVKSRGGKGEDAEERNRYPMISCLGARGTLLRLSRRKRKPIAALRY